MNRLNGIVFSVLFVAVTAFGGGVLIAHFIDLSARDAWMESYAPFFWVAFISLMLWCIAFVRAHPTCVRLGLSSILTTALILLVLMR